MSGDESPALSNFDSTASLSAWSHESGKECVDLLIYGYGGIGKSSFLSGLLKGVHDGFHRQQIIYIRGIDLPIPVSVLQGPSRNFTCTSRVRGRSQSLILRKLGLLERERQDLEHVMRSRTSSRTDLIIQRRLFGVEELPSEENLKILMLVLAAAIHSLATLVIRSHSRHRASLTARRGIAGTSGCLRRRLLESIRRTTLRTESVQTPTHESSAIAAHKPAFLRHRQCEGTRRLVGNPAM
jgi:hypothetical protein